ncbi:cytochrome P450 [Streptomyces sp. NPDC002677]|uniref:cytochrome P450 n=1 Tax=Streptomyces sp. NPDC002677 TaxID=3154774 RepID=UPI00331D95F6
MLFGEETSAPPVPAGRGQGCPFGFTPETAQTQTEAPGAKVACPTGIDAWLITRYADVREVFADTARFSSQPGSIAHLVHGLNPDAPIVEGDFPRMDGAEHLRLRRAIAPELSPRQLDALRPAVQRIVDDLIDELATAPGPADFCTQLITPVTTQVIARLLDVPYADRGVFQKTAMTLFDTTTSEDEVIKVGLPLFEYLLKLVQDRRGNPGEDLLSRIIARGERTERPFTDTELVMTSAALLVGGFASTDTIAACGLLALFQQPTQLDRLRAEPEQAGNAVEELIRFGTSSLPGSVLRRATEDTHIAGQAVAAGDYVVAVVQTANREEALVPDPDVLDIGRKPVPHLGFGHGPHQCVGQQLARLELKAVFETLLRRIPTIRPALPLEQIVFKKDSVVPGPAALPITWEAVLPARETQ